MNSKKTGNPLIKRIPRELKTDWKKYFVISIFLILVIGFVSGLYVANNSMIKAADESADKYKLEDGHFELTKKADEELIKKISSETNSKIYEFFYRNENEDNDNDGKSDGTIRVYVKNDEINEACIMDGRLPENENEVAIDRMHADNAGITVDDEIKIGDYKYKVVGLIAYVNYSTLHEKNTDLMFDAINFDVGMLTKDGFDRLGERIHYSYSWFYNEKPVGNVENKEASDEFLENMYIQVLSEGNDVEDYLPAYTNNAIQFAVSDIESDKSLGEALLAVFIVIIAFIFALTISNTISKESAVIGTLRASGYTKGELVFHLVSTPMVVTVISALIGNVLGYTVFKDAVVNMYYNSYSLPSYKTLWNSEAFVKTTIVPMVIMLVVNLVIITNNMKKTPLQFLRHDLKKRKRQKTVRLPRVSFFSRFRMRIILQNISNYLMLFVGISFVMVLLAFSIGMPETLDYYKKTAADSMISKYQYVLMSCVDKDGNVVETENEDAEKYLMTSLLYKEGEHEEEISLYGIAGDSGYIRSEQLSSLKEGEIVITDSFSEKFSLKEGDTIILDEKYADESYEYKIAGFYEGTQSVAAFVREKSFRENFSVDDGMFTGFFSDSKIDDLDTDLIAAVITEKEITKMCDQLDLSMGSMLEYFQYLCIGLSIILIYLLTKIIIEKNENAISMTKILGYQNSEIARLYLLSTTFVVVIESMLGIFVGQAVMRYYWKIMIMDYSGWYAFKLSAAGYIKMFVFVIVGYMAAALLDFNRIKKIRMDEALKNIE